MANFLKGTDLPKVDPFLCLKNVKDKIPSEEPPSTFKNIFVSYTILDVALSLEILLSTAGFLPIQPPKKKYF